MSMVSSEHNRVIAVLRELNDIFDFVRGNCSHDVDSVRLSAVASSDKWYLSKEMDKVQRQTV